MVRIAHVPYVAVEVGDTVDFADRTNLQRPRRDVIVANIFRYEAVALERLRTLGTSPEGTLDEALQREWCLRETHNAGPT